MDLSRRARILGADVSLDPSASDTPLPGKRTLQMNTLLALALFLVTEYLLTGGREGLVVRFHCRTQACVSCEPIGTRIADDRGCSLLGEEGEDSARVPAFNMRCVNLNPRQ